MAALGSQHASFVTSRGGRKEEGGGEGRRIGERRREGREDTEEKQRENRGYSLQGLVGIDHATSALGGCMCSHSKL